MTEGTFHRVEDTDKRMYGPRGLVVCGYPPEEHAPLAEFMARLGGEDLSVIFVPDEGADRSLEETLALPHRSGEGLPSSLRRAMVLSGFTQRELHALMAAYRKAGLPAQLWATLTPTSESWTVRGLLEELACEAEAMKKNRK